MQYVKVTPAPAGQRTAIGDWIDRARCVGRKDFLKLKPVDAALRFCTGCPVLDTCRAFGSDSGSTDTVYGGVLMPKYPAGTRGRNYLPQT